MVFYPGRCAVFRSSDNDNHNIAENQNIIDITINRLTDGERSKEAATEKVNRSLEIIGRATVSHLRKMRNKPVNEFGYKELKYTGMSNGKPYSRDYFVRNGQVLYSPDTIVENAGGAYKKISKRDESMVDFSINYPAHIDKLFMIKPVEVATLFSDLKITHIEGLHNPKDGVFVARNQGIPLPESDKKHISIFRKSLYDLKTLHAQGFSHSDIKPNNFVIKNSDAVLIDLDSFKHTSTKIPEWAVGGTRAYTTLALRQKLYPQSYLTGGIDMDEHPEYGSTEDQFSFLLSILEHCAEIYPTEKAYENGGVQITGEIEKFLRQITAAPDQYNYLCELLADPVLFYLNYKGRELHLYNMINWQSNLNLEFM